MSTSPKIDAHQHFWQISRGDYDWMTDGVADIRRDTLPADLSPLLAKHDIAGTVVVQAAATIAETEFLLRLAKDTPFIKGVVGWVDLEDPACPSVLDHLMVSSVFKGVRPMLQDIEDTNWILRPTVMANLAAIAERGLPHLPIAIDHCAKPVIAGGADAVNTWRDGMARLAALPNTRCKISGLVNEAGPGWNAQSILDVVTYVVDHFGSNRTMWGSDWPVLNLAGDCAQWRAVSDTLFADLNDLDKADIYGGTATRFYGLELSS